MDFTVLFPGGSQTRLRYIRSQWGGIQRPPAECCKTAYRAGLLSQLPDTQYLPKRDTASGDDRCVLCGLSVSRVVKYNEDCQWSQEGYQCPCHPPAFVRHPKKWPGESLWDKTEEERARSFREQKESERESFEKRRREEKEAWRKRAAERKAAEDARLINRVFNFLNTSSLSILFHPLLIIPWCYIVSLILSYLFVCFTF